MALHVLLVIFKNLCNFQMSLVMTEDVSIFSFMLADSDEKCMMFLDIVLFALIVCLKEDQRRTLEK